MPDELEMGNIDLAEPIGVVVDDTAFEAKDRGRHVRVAASEPICALGHREMLRRAVENVVRNAVRYTKDGSAVEIELLKGHGQ